MSYVTAPKRWLPVVVLAALVLVAIVSWPLIALGTIALSGESRPALLADARWNNPVSARAFNARFSPGSREADLLDWLASNGFDMDRKARAAHRWIKGYPCAEAVDVAWSALPDGTLGSAHATVKEAGCL